VTTLDLTPVAGTAGGAEPPDLQMRVKWHVVTAWLVAAVLGTNGYRMLAPHEAPNGDAQAIKELRAEVAALNQRVAVLIAIVERVEDAQQRDQLQPTRERVPRRQFDH
jgi:hypothetical protein